MRGGTRRRSSGTCVVSAAGCNGVVGCDWSEEAIVLTPIDAAGAWGRTRSMSASAWPALAYRACGALASSRATTLATARGTCGFSLSTGGGSLLTTL